MVKINPKSKIWFLTRIGREIEWRIEKRKRICLQNLIPSRREREFFPKSWISRGEREFFLQNLDIREHLEKWKFNSPARDRKKWTISSRDFLEIENLVNACYAIYEVNCFAISLFNKILHPSNTPQSNLTACLRSQSGWWGMETGSCKIKLMGKSRMRKKRRQAGWIFPHWDSYQCNERNHKTSESEHRELTECRYGNNYEQPCQKSAI